VVGGNLGGLSGEQQEGSASTTVLKLGSKKNAAEYRSLFVRETTRCRVDLNLRLQARCLTIVTRL